VAFLVALVEDSLEVLTEVPVPALVDSSLVD
jgi:hypothetical protein